MSTEIATKTNAAIDFTAEQKTLIKNTVAQGSTDAELGMFLELAKSTGLNPFKKEIWFIKTAGYTKRNGDAVEGRVQMMTGIEGFFRIANGNPAYDGIEHEYGPALALKVNVKAGFDKDQKWSDVEVIAPEWVESVVYRKDRTRPERRRAYWREFAQDVVSNYGKMTIWGQKPLIMLEKCADALALRKAFPQELGSFYVPEEMPKEFSAEDEERKSAAEVEAQARANYLKQRTQKIADTGDYVIEFGNSQRGAKVSEATNSVWLEKHLAKHADQIPEAGKKIIQAKIAELKRAYAQRMEAERASENDQGWTPTPEEAAEIAAMEQAEQGDE